jgi:uncharacterized membrane protein YdjX (TVP38/TMEM64 family)
VGPWFPLAFLAGYIVVTVLPFPRTAFTLAAGLLFGPMLGVTLAVVASTAGAVIALLLVRAAGWQLSRLVSHQAVETVDARLRDRGWIAVMSLRLIPVVPFSVLNYAAGASAVRVLPYTLATLAGMLPGTAAVVILGDALTGDVSPLLLVSLCTGVLGLGLLAYEIRHHRRHKRTGDGNRRRRRAGASRLNGCAGSLRDPARQVRLNYRLARFVVVHRGETMVSPFAIPVVRIPPNRRGSWQSPWRDSGRLAEHGC